METAANVSVLAIFVIASSVLSLLCLLALHFVSPEYKPSWRMVSEYALGKHKWLLTVFFLLWGFSSICLSFLLWNVVTSIWGTIGVILLFISGVGATMGGLFDVKHKLHGMAFILGVPSLPIAALLVGYNIINVDNWSARSTSILISSHATWISLILMGGAMAMMFSGFKKAGIKMEKDAKPPDTVPDGVIALGGYANRLLVSCYILWLIVVANTYLSV